MSPHDTATKLKLVKPGAARSKTSFFEEWLRAAPGPSSDPRGALLKMALAEPLRKTLAEKLEPFGVELKEEIARDKYGKRERAYTHAKGPGVDAALLQIPEWIVADGNNVGSIDEISTAFRGRVVRIFSPGPDASDRGLRTMLRDWKDQHDIDGHFVPSIDVRGLEEGRYEVGEILELELERHADAGDAAQPDPDADAPKTGRVFVSYSHKDRSWLDEIMLQLEPILRQDTFSVWNDKKIPPGSRWGDEIERELENASVALLLVSRHFLASNFIHDKELPPLLERADKEDGFRILWVYLSECNFEETPIKEFDAAHEPLEPLEGLGLADKNRVLKEISQVIKRAATGEDDE